MHIDPQLIQMDQDVVELTSFWLLKLCAAFLRKRDDFPGKVDREHDPPLLSFPGAY